MQAEKEQVALSSIAASAVLTIAKALVGFSTGSLAILSEAGHSLIDLGATVMTYVAVRISGNLISNSGETLHRAALAGVGIFLAAGFLVRDDLESGELVRLLPEYRPIEFSMNAIYPHRHHLSAKVRTFIDLLARHSAEQQKLINPYA